MITGRVAGRGDGRRTRRPKTKNKRGRFTATTRFAAGSAEQYIDSDSTDEWDTDPSEVEDAPKQDDVPIDYRDDEDADLFDTEPDLHAPVSSWTPWVRLAIFLRDGQLDFRTDVPDTNERAVEESLHHLGEGWAAMARTLIRTQGEALRCSTPLAALHALSPYPMKDLERSVGQGSRDRRVIINTPFGLAPLWFFAQGRRDGLFDDLERIGRAVMAVKPDVLTRAMIETTVRRPSVMPSTIQRVHGRALLALARHPEILARHRTLWPMSTPSDLYDDLGVVATGPARLGRSGPVAILALTGAFDSPELLLASPTTTPKPRREV